ncbi:MAG TPA: BatD family protein [Bacteroidia bacterium]|nr:BatD family protein [Bacteroidia bacterium]
MPGTITITHSNRLLRALGIAVFWFVIIPLSAGAQTLTATVTKNPVAVNDQFELKFTLDGSGTKFRAPSLNDFMVLSGPNQSQSMQFYNGSMSQSLTFSYILQAKKEGTFRINPALIESGGKDISSMPISITVVKGQPGSGQAQGNQQSQGEKTNISTNNIFIRVSVDKSSVYLGEAIVVTYKLYSNVQLVNYAISKVPALTGFWSHDLEMPAQLQLHNENINGVTYQVGEIKKAVIFPQQSGTLTIDPMEGEVIARIQVKRAKSNNPFDLFNDPFFNDPFFGAGGYRDVRYAVKSDPVRVTVKDLPPNPPSSFKGAVGKFSMAASIDKPAPKANDAVSLKVKISGSGNLKLLDAPSIAVPEDIETYEPKTTDNVAFSVKGANGTRTIEYLLIPRIPGKYDLGEVAFSYFDPAKKSYVTINKGPFSLQVEKGADGGYATVGSGKSEFKVLGRDIRFIKTNVPDFIETGHSFVGSWLFWLLVILPPLLFAGALLYYRKNREALMNVALMRSKKAGKMARKRLSKAKALLDTGNEAGFYDETSKALWDYSGHKLGIPVASLSKEILTAKLLGSGIDKSLVQGFSDLIDSCEMSRFAGAVSNGTPSAVYEKAIELISSIENGLSK